MTDIIIRAARPADHAALQRIFELASLSNEDDAAALQAHPEVLILDAQLIARGRTRVATLLDGTVVGFASTSHARERVLDLDDLFVDPDWQRHGAARQLIRQICQESIEQDLSRIEVTANAHAMAFYLALGFVNDGKTTTELGDGVRMHLTVQ